jgi:predicted ArsR family transcriptional regulator
VTLGELCEELGLSEGTATAFLAMLAREGRVRICEVELAGRGRDPGAKLARQLQRV